MSYGSLLCGFPNSGLRSFVAWLIIITLLGVFYTAPVRANQQCTSKVYEQPGDVILTMIISLRENGGKGTCGDVSYEALQLLMAVKYVVEKLNSPGNQSGQMFVPGVKLGLEIFDDCGNADYAVSHAMTTMRRSFPEEITQCSAEQTSPIYAGIIGSSRSPTTSAIATLLRNNQLPIVSFAATLSELSNKTLYPTLMRTVLSDKKQIEAMLLLAKKLSWTMLAIVHTDGNYGTTGAQELKVLAKKHNICVILTETISNSNRNTQSVVSLVGRLLDKQRKNTSGKLGVIYIGQRKAGQDILHKANSLSLNSNEYNIKWIMSDSIGTNLNVFQQVSHLSDSVLTISPISTKLTEFGQYFQNEITTVSEGRNKTVPNGWLEQYVSKECNIFKKLPSCTMFDQNDYVTATIDAVYALSTSIKEFHQAVCKGASGVCSEWRTTELNLFSDTRSVQVDYANLDQSHSPPEFASSSRNFQFDQNGDIIFRPIQSLLYHINVFTGNSFRTVGNYSEEDVHLDMDQLNTVGHSSCGKVCQECLDIQPFIYIPGEVLIAAFFSIHEASTEKDDPFGCGDMRASATVIPSLEAFLLAFSEKRTTSDEKRIGVVVFNDCYNSLKADEIITSYFSGKVPLIDRATGDVIDPQNFVAVIGAEPSGVSVPLAISTTRLQLPQISYASSTPDLDERILYPYFLRTVPSDEVQAKAMIEIVKNMKWKYINVVYTNNNYGLKGMLKIKEFATNAKICVAKPIKISESPDQIELNEITRTLSKNEAKIVVFFGIREGILRLLKTLQSHKIHSFTFVASEDMGINILDLVGMESVAAGLMVVTLDTSNTEQTNFHEYLKKKKPSDDDINPWFSRFWQDHFGCNIPSSFEKKYARDCDVSQTLDIDTNDQRIVHTTNAVMAVMTGLESAQKFLCHLGETEFACKKYHEHPDIVVEHIKNVNLFDRKHEIQFKPFRENGNGNIGFIISNLQRNEDGINFEYKQVGTYDTQGLQLVEDTIQFYDSDRKATKTIESICPPGAICNECHKLIGEEVSVPNSTTNDGGDKLLAIFVVGVICLVVIVMVVLLVCCILVQNKNRDARYKGQTTGSTLDRQDNTDQVSRNGTTAMSFFQNPPSTTYNSPAASEFGGAVNSRRTGYASSPKNEHVRTQVPSATVSVTGTNPIANRLAAVPPNVAPPTSSVVQELPRQMTSGIPLEVRVSSTNAQQIQETSLQQPAGCPVSLSAPPGLRLQNGSEPQGHVNSSVSRPAQMSAMITDRPNYPGIQARPAHPPSVIPHGRHMERQKQGGSMVYPSPLTRSTQPPPFLEAISDPRLLAIKTGAPGYSSDAMRANANNHISRYIKSESLTDRDGSVFRNPTFDTVLGRLSQPTSADITINSQDEGYADMSGVRDMYLTAKALPNSGTPNTAVTNV